MERDEGYVGLVWNKENEKDMCHGMCGMEGHFGNIDLCIIGTLA